jgi:spore coat protein CotH
MARSLLRFALLAAAICACGASAVLSGVLRTEALPATLDPRSASADDFFGITKLYTFELRIAAADFQKMPPVSGGGGRGLGGGGLENGYEKVPATLRFEGRDWGPITVRYKGNSSYRSARSELKRSLKLIFRGSGTGRFFGMTTVNLNNNAFDSSQMRETLAFEVFRRAEVPAPRTAYAKVFITVPGQYQHAYAGLFTIVEQIDQTFFRERWGHKLGVLVKPEGLDGLPDLGNNWQAYAEGYSAKGAATTSDAARLIECVQFLDHSSDEDFARHAGEYLDLEEFLRFLAAEVVLVNTDSPLAMNHNYWLTIHPTTRKMVWIPWDMNMAFGGFHNGDSRLSLSQPSAPGMFPLATRVLSNPQFFARYKKIVRDMLLTNFNLDRLDGEMHRVAASIQDAVAIDPTTTTAKFEANLAAAPVADTDNTRGGGGQEFRGFGFGGRIGPPLRQFIGERIDSVRDQLDGKTTGTAGLPGFGRGWGN